MNATVTKSSLAKLLAEETGIPSRQAKAAINLMVRESARALRSGGRVQINGFGVFSVRKMPPRGGFNPKTKQAIRIPARRVVKFKATKGLV